MIVKVTQKHIDESAQAGRDTNYSEKGCMLEQALRDATGDPSWYVGWGTCGRRGHENMPYKIPEWLQKKISQFDNNRYSVQPFEFDLEEILKF